MAIIDNLVVYWKLDEASGNRADSHSTNTLTDNNTVTSAAAILNNGGSFSAGNLEYLSIADNAALSTGDIDYSWQWWVKLASAGSQRVGPGKWAVPQREYLLWYDSTGNRFNFNVSYDGTNNTGVAANNFGAVSMGVFYCIHCGHDSVNNLIWITVNAGTADTAAHSTGSFDSSSAFEIGRNAEAAALSAFYMDGVVDEVAFWKRTLSSGDRTSLYNSGAGLAYPFSSGSAIKTINGLALASVKTVDGLAVASMKTRNGLA